MALKDIIGHEHAIEILKGCITRNRIAHAYIFTGEDGVGKRLTAINFAKILNCQGQGTDIDCCDKCSSCIKINNAFHPDIFLIAPEKGEIIVAAIRKLIESFSYKAFEGNWKVAIIDEAETLNQSAANAFLKTLEEPPTQSILILISSMPQLIPVTILSRCFRINFSPLPAAKLRGLLEDNPHFKSTPDDAKVLSILSAGRPAQALNRSLLESRDRLFSAFKSLINHVEEDLWEGRDSMEEWFDWVHLWIRDIAVLNATNRSDLLINQDISQEIMDISKKAELNDILRLSRIFHRIKESLRFNLNKKITLYHTHFLLKETFSKKGYR